MPVEIDDVGRRNGDARTFLVIGTLAVGHDHVEAIDGAALEEANQNRTGRWAEGLTGGKCRAREKQRIQAQAHQRQATGLYEHASRDRHCLWKSGPPKASPTAMVRACVG